MNLRNGFIKSANARDAKKEAASYGLSLDLSTDEARARLLGAHKTSLLNFPAFPTRFVGREAEIAQLRQEIQKPEVRLLTLLSQGGMGKTRLAVEVGRALGGHFADGICFASFVSTPTPEQLPFTLGDALNFSFFGNDSAEVQLLRFLKDKEMLLILDNLEHLLEGTRFISELLLLSPKLKILATSRESLNLQTERIYELKGLHFSEENDSVQTDSDAANLFVQAARNRQPEFELNAETTQDINKLCQLVGGMPLALELSASWLRALSLQSIVQELETSIDLLQTTARDLPQRHQSIRAVFDYSWQLLSEEEQSALRKLAVFQGGFSREAAKEVTGTSLVTLANLIDKSFLSKVGNDRYRRHPLVIQYAQEKMAEYPEEKAQVEESHALYFFSCLRRYLPKLRSMERKQSLALIDLDLPNIKAAWTWAVKTRCVNEIKETSIALSEALKNRNLEAVDLFELAHSQLDESNPLHLSAIAYILIFLDRYRAAVGKASIKRSLAHKGLALARQLDEK